MYDELLTISDPEWWEQVKQWRPPTLCKTCSNNFAKKRTFVFDVNQIKLIFSFKPHNMYVPLLSWKAKRQAASIPTSFLTHVDIDHIIWKWKLYIFPYCLVWKENTGHQIFFHNSTRFTLEMLQSNRFSLGLLQLGRHCFGHRPVLPVLLQINNALRPADNPFDRQTNGQSMPSSPSLRPASP